MPRSRCFWPPARRRSRTSSSSTPGRTRRPSPSNIAEKVGACWFDGKHKAFASYSYAPEAGASSTRILIVPKEAPHERPVLVVEVRSARRGTDVRLFGPLMQTGDAGAIRRDVMRWTGGAHDC